jgi:hypothetical protein
MQRHAQHQSSGHCRQRTRNARFPEPALDPEGGKNGSPGVVLVRNGRAKQRHETIVQETTDRAFESLDLGLCFLEELVHKAKQSFGAEMIAEEGCVAHLAVQERCQSVLTFGAYLRALAFGSGCDVDWLERRCRRG